MNKSYRIVWNKARNCLMVVSEATKARGKGAAKSLTETVAAAVLALGAAGSPVSGGLSLGLIEPVIAPGVVALAGGLFSNLAEAQTVQTITGAQVAPVVVAPGNSVVFLQNATVTGGTVGAAMVSGGFISNAGTISVSANDPALRIGGNSGLNTISGDIVNTGLIENTKIYGGGTIPYAIYVNRSYVSGAIQNYGQIGIGSGDIGLQITNSTIAGGLSITGSIFPIGMLPQSSTAISIAQSSISGIYTGSSSQIGQTDMKGIVINGSTVGPMFLAGAISSWLTAGNYSIQATNSSLASISNTGSMGAVVLDNVQLNGSIFSNGFVREDTTYYNLSGARNAISLINGTTLTGGIVNAGTMGFVSISGGVAGSLLNGGFTNQQGASLIGLTVQSGSTISGSVSNAGYLGNLAQYINPGVGTVTFVGYLSVLGATVGNVSNAASGTINGGGVNVNNANILQGFTNAGLIQASGLAVAIQNSTLTGTFANSGTIEAGGTASGVSISGVSGLSAITNTGSIAGRAQSGFAISSVSGLAGIYNAGTISSIGASSQTSYGLYVNNATGLSIINNAGAIYSQQSYYGSGAALAVFNQSSPLVVVNTGTIHALSFDAASISISGATDLTFNNSGYIGAGPYGAGLSLRVNDSTVTGVVVQTGTIVGNVEIINSQIQDAMTVVGSFGGNISLSQAVFSGGIKNQGTVQGVFSVSNGNVAGDFVNDALMGGIQIASATVQGSIVNIGSIASGGSGRNININAASVAGGITNSGYIGTINLKNLNSQVGAGIGYTVVGAISNSGTIETINIGSGLLGGGLINAASGRVTSGINISQSPASSPYVSPAASVSGAIINYGTIYGGGPGGLTVKSNATVSGAILNAGSISQVNFGTQFQNGLASKIEAGFTNTGVIGYGATAVYVDGRFNLAGGISNTGLITASGTAFSINTATVDRIVNDVAGTISGTSYGFRLGVLGTNTYWNRYATITGSLLNSGLIEAASGIALSVAVSTIGGAFVNSASGTIRGATAISVVNSSIAGGISNSGLIFGTSGVAVTASGNNTGFTLTNLQAGTIVGAINGQLNVSNSGLLSLQTSTGLQTGSTVASVIDGNYYQASTGQLRIGVVDGASGSGTLSGHYSTLSVSGTAQFAGAGKIFVDFAANSPAIQAGQTIIGVLNAGTLTATSFSILDNSAVVNFQWQTVGGTLNLVAVSSVIICGSTVSGAQSGPCQMDASNYPNLTVTSLGSISGGSQGVQVLAANITGRLMNSGSILGNNTGVQFVTGATLSGGVTNAGLISGATGILYQASVSGGVLSNQAGASIVGSSGAGVSIAGSALVSSIQNAGYISSINNVGSLGGVNNTGSVGAVVNSGTLNTVANTGTMNSLSNLGSISSLNNNGSLVSLNNSGTVSSLIQSGGLLTGLTNSGLISAATAVGVTGGTLASLTNTGSIIGSGMGVIVSSGATLTGLNNQGYISGLNNAGAVGAVVNSGSVASVANTGTLTSINNSGTMNGLTQAGGLLTGLTNSGLISGATAVGITGGTLASLTNTGSIIGSGMGVVVAASASLTGLNNQGYISGLNNAGVVSSLVNSGSVASLANSGTVASLNNSGTVSSINNTGALSSLVNTGAISNGITNAGLIGGSAVAITNSGSTVALLNQASGTVVGAINGNLNVSNSGIIALQSAYNGTTYAGSPVNASISGNYAQASSGILQFAVNGSASNHSSLTVGGTANFAANSTLSIVMSTASAVSGGQTLAGLVTAGSLVSNGFTIVDNSALVNFRYATVGGALSLVAFNTPNCGSVVGGYQLGACEVGIGIPSLTVTGLGTISGGTQGINVLAANLTGRIINQGTVQGTATGIRFLAGGTLSGGVTNSGLIEGLGYAALVVNNASVGGVANNGGTITAQGRGINALAGAVIGSGITNTGLIANNNSTAAGAAAIALDAATLVGGLLNTGNITSSGSGVLLAANAQLQGGLTNSGSIIGGGNAALYITGSTLSGVLGNSGFMAGVSLKSQALIANGVNNTGLISLSTGISIANNSTIAGGVTNSGTIIGSGNYGISLGRTSALMGGVTNLAGASIVGGVTGIALSRYSVVSAITNAGLIMGNSAFGAAIGLSLSTITGDLINTGSIASLGAYALVLDQTSAVLGVVTNDHGYISGINNAGSIGGIQNHTGVIANGINNTGTIGSSVFMYYGTLTGGLTNSGSLQGVIAYASSLVGDVANQGGTIASTTVGVSIHMGSTVTGALTNTGMITGQRGVTLTAAVITGGITNSGSIVGTSGAGIEVATNTTLSGLNNAGYVSSVSNAGLLSAVNNSGTVGSVNNTGTLISVVNAGVISNGVTNSGLIYNASGSSITASGTVFTVSNDSAGTMAGAFNGTMDVSNSGLIALQTMAGGTISAGTSLSAAITGNYVQATAGTLQIGVNGISGSGTIAGNYSTLTVGGSATFAANSKIKISMSSTTSAVQGQTLAGVVTAASLTSNGFTITDNSALVEFAYSTTSGVLSLVAIAPTTVACGTVSSSVQGPCLMAFNAPNVLVTGLGTISGGSTGIRVLSGAIAGGILNQGSVIGTSYGVSVNQGATTISGSLSNTGLIQGGIAGVYLSNTSVAGGLNNASAGTISGAIGLSLVAGSTLSGGLTNAGLITAGISLNASSIQNGFANLGGTVTGGNQGLNMALGSSLTGGLTNTGLLNGSVVGVGAALSSLNGGLNNGGGTISGGTQGVVLSQSMLVGGLTNAGLITGLAGSGVNLTASGLNGSLSNQSSGTISGAQYGLTLNASTVTAGVTNAGLITGSSLAGMYVASSNIGGSVINNGGTITGAQQGLIVNGSTISGNVSNSGYLQAVTYAGLALGQTNITGAVINQVGGSITGYYGAGFNGSTVAGGIANAGLMQGTYSGLYLVTSSIANGVNNLAGGSITGGTQGLYVSAAQLNGGLNNAVNATISGGVTGLRVTAGGVINGGLTNSGLITGTSSVGVIVAGASTINGGLNNLALATISGASVGLSVSGSLLGNGLTNTGLITGGSLSGVSLVSSSVGGNINNLGGTLSGVNQAGLNVSGTTISGNLSNTGLITGLSSTGVNLASSLLTGNLNNQGGTISGLNNGLSVGGSTIATGITNSGLITGSSVGGMVIAGASTVNGGLNNTANATISGGVTGLNVSANSVVNGGLTNAGLITGGTYAINAPALTSIVTNGANASFGGTVSAANATLSISSGTLTGANGLNVSSVSVAGGTQLNLVTSTASSISGGITAPNGVTNSGVVNVGMAAATITGNYMQAPSGALRIGALGPNNHGSLNVTGLASFAPNASIQMVTITGATFANGNTLSGVINAGSLSATTFNVASNSALLNFTAAIVGNSVNITTQISSTTSIPSAVASQGNTAGIGAANSLNTVFNSFVAGSPTYASMNTAMAAFANMTSNQQISQAVSQSLPVLSSESPLQTLAVLTAINQSIEARSLKLRGVSSGHEMYGNNTVWMKPFGSWMNQGNMNGAYGFKANAGGLMLGADHQWDDKVRMGGAFAWGNSSANSNMGGQNQTSNMYQFIGYGAYALTPSVNVNFQANGGWNNNTTSRNISFLGTNAQGSYDSAVWHAGVGVDRPTKLSEDTTFIPQARFDYTWIRNQGYSETGAAYGMGLNVGSQTYQTSVLGVDAKVEHKLTDHNSVSANLGVGYNFSPTQTWVAASYQGASSLQFTTTGVNPSATMGRAGLGYTYKVKEGVDVGIRYDIDVQEKYTNQVGTAKARWNF